MLALAPLPEEEPEVALAVAALDDEPLPPELAVPVTVADPVAVAVDADPVASATPPHWEAFQGILV